MSGAEARRVGVVRIPENRNVGPVLSNIYRVDTRYVADDQVGRSGRVLGDELMRGQEPLQLTAEEEIDPHEQDRRHRSKLAGKKDSAPPAGDEFLQEPVQADAFEAAVEIDPEDVEALEEEEEPERHHDPAADELDRCVVVAQPAERPH